MQGVEHVDAVDPVVVGVEHHESRRRQNADRVEHDAQRHARPLADRRPPFLAGVPRDLGSRRQPLQIGQREGARCRARAPPPAAASRRNRRPADGDSSGRAPTLPWRRDPSCRSRGTTSRRAGVYSLHERLPGQQRPLCGVGERVAHAQQVAVGRRQLLGYLAAANAPRDASPATIARRRVMSGVLMSISQGHRPASAGGIRT